MQDREREDTDVLLKMSPGEGEGIKWDNRNLLAYHPTMGGPPCALSHPLLMLSTSKTLIATLEFNSGSARHSPEKFRGEGPEQA